MSRPASLFPNNVVHVGLHKTATSWFQQEFYPAVTNAQYLSRDHVHEEIIRPRPANFSPDEARSRLNLDCSRPTIICEEELSGSIHTGGRHGFARPVYARRISAVIRDAEVVVVNRDLPSLVASSYRQYVRVGGTKGPEEYVEGWPFHPRNPSFEIDHFSHRPLVDLYADEFDESSVHVYEFSKFLSDPRKFCVQLAEDLHLEYDSAEVQWDRRVNRGYPAGLLPLARIFNLLTKRDVIDKRYLANVPGWYSFSRRILEALNRWDVLRTRSGPDKVLGEELTTRLREHEWES